MVALLHAHHAAGDVGTVVKDERYRNLGSLDGRLLSQELSADGFALGSFATESGFGEGARDNGGRGVDDFLLFGDIVAGVGVGAAFAIGCARCCCVLFLVFANRAVGVRCILLFCPWKSSLFVCFCRLAAGSRTELASPPSPARLCSSPSSTAAFLLLVSMFAAHVEKLMKG